MIRSFSRVFLGLFFFIFSVNSYADSQVFVPTSVPEGLGLNIHFLDPAPGEMKMLADSGVRWVRMDFTWDFTEKEKGVYDFSAYDRLMNSLDEYHLRALFILDYGNPLYDRGLAPHTEAGRAAFVRWAVAAAKHFSGKRILWEIWNEPNQDNFWKPKTKVEDYILLALALGKSFHEEVPKESLIGPASAHVPQQFLIDCFKAGLLEYWSAVTIHPYRGSKAPETATQDFRRLKNSIQKYWPASPSVPVLSGEWGYSSSESGLNEEKQAKYLTRMWLNNLANQIPLTIWYDWKDDGDDPKNPEHHFGLIHVPVLQDGQWHYPPKLSYLAAKTLTKTLDGFKFERRLNAKHEKDYILEFSKGKESRFAVWTASEESHCVCIPEIGENVQRVNYIGESLGTANACRNGLLIRLSDKPEYLMQSH